MEIHLVKPQVRDHPNNVPTSKDFKKSAMISTLNYTMDKIFGTIFYHNLPHDKL